MKLNLTKAEYKRLLDVLEIADWIIASREAKETPRTAPYKKLQQKLFTLAKEHECEDLVEYEEQFRSYIYTDKFDNESPSMKFIQEYNNDTFWDELIDRLARRDFILEVGQEKFEKLEPIERYKGISRYEDKYDKEFRENGLSGIRIEEEKS